MAFCVTVLVDNVMGAPGLTAEHGLAVHVQAGDHAVLFDTGQSGTALMDNARALGIDLTRVEAVVISHGHHDHTGGLPALLDVNQEARLYLHPDAVGAHHGQRGDGSRPYVGMPTAGIEAVRSASDRVVWTEAPTEIVEGVHATGPVPRITPFESASKGFSADPEGQAVDPFRDDQAIWLDTESGPVVILGCAHSGVINTLEHIAGQCGTSHIHALMGGMHLGGASETRLKLTTAAIQQYGLGLLAPGHCTGSAGVERMRSTLPGVFHDYTCGTSFSWD
jgi:7,8-dihydropterin-6-yl-methyl-4-(beta-D-ribofuranosyl)aminobenzene 5'-phosphate synthase